MLHVSVSGIIYFINLENWFILLYQFYYVNESIYICITASNML